MEGPRADSTRTLVDFTGVPRRLQTAGGILAAVMVAGCVLDGAINGLTFGVIGRWAGLFAVGMLLATAVITAAHALAGAERAGKRGQRLSAPDVGIRPRRLNVVPDATTDEAAATPASDRPDRDDG
ncbi:hypothetical protein BH24ACT15_BH24ACT15_07160 [soil metagenome]